MRPRFDWPYRRIVLAALLAGAGCSGVTVPDGELICGNGLDASVVVRIDGGSDAAPPPVCPPGFECRADDRCWRTDGTANAPEAR